MAVLAALDERPGFPGVGGRRPVAALEANLAILDCVGGIMTEAEWLAQTHPSPMLTYLRGTASNRKLRLFACACCRRVLHLMPDGRSKWALGVAEAVADGLADDIERNRASEMRRGLPNDHVGWALLPDAFDAAQSGAMYTAGAVASATKPARRQAARAAESLAQVEVLCDIFGNPFRPVTGEPAWLTSDVLALANGIYEERAFDRMPILADALQDAGCTNEVVLNHCRDASQPHARGCWVVDLLLNKS